VARRSDRIAPRLAAHKSAPGGLDQTMWQNGECTNGEKNELPGSHERSSSIWSIYTTLCRTSAGRTFNLLFDLGHTPEGIAIMIRQLSRILAGLAALLLMTCVSPWIAPSSAATIIGAPVVFSTLANVPGATIVVGDKTFGGFTYTPTGDMPSAALVNVIPITDNAGNFGIRFQGAFIDTTGVVGGSDALITYNVSADASHLISDAHLEGNPSRLGPLGSISVTETFLPLGANGQFTMKIYDDQNVNPPKLVDNTVFTTPVKTLSVQKDILGLAKVNPNSPDLPSTVTMSFVDQTFSQIVVPEPTTIALLFASTFGLALMRRRS
jgi:hypothetical protein